MNDTVASVESIVGRFPQEPVFAFRPNALERACKYFLAQFSGNILYAVKTNPEQHVVTYLRDYGVKSFDVASLEEVRLIHHNCPDATMYFMHPVKSRQAIREAYFTYGVRHFSLDTLDELQKIMQETNHAKDLSLFVRLSMPNTYAELNLAEKFGINIKEAQNLLKEARGHADKLGICFHVGSQCMHPDAYRIAMRMAANAIKESGVSVEFFNIGGGFPSIYPGMIPPMLDTYFEAIHEEFNKINAEAGGKMTMICEPGRAIVAESTSVIVRVELRKGNTLYINDGTYGSLFDAGTPHFIFPVRLHRPGAGGALDSAHMAPFSFYGPTCDTLDFMKGPFYLPENAREGDYIEVGQIGAYGRTLASRFNGFGHEEGVVLVNDEPLMTMYNEEVISKQPLEIIAA